jgi:hypothetical protein
MAPDHPLEIEGVGGKFRRAVIFEMSILYRAATLKSSSRAVGYCYILLRRGGRCPQLAFNLWFNRIRDSPCCCHERSEGLPPTRPGVVLALTKTQLSNQSDAGDQAPAPRARRRRGL